MTPKKPWAELSDHELAEIAQQGMKGQGAPVEAMRRLRLAIDKASSSSDRYATRMWWLTVVIGLLTLVQAIAAGDSIWRLVSK